MANRRNLSQEAIKAKSNRFRDNPNPLVTYPDDKVEAERQAALIAHIHRVFDEAKPEAKEKARVASYGDLGDWG